MVSAKIRSALLMVVPMVALLLLISPNWKPDQDSVAYLSMARSFAAGRGMLHLGLHQWHYAPLYSIVISPAFWFEGRPFLCSSLINIFTAWMLIVGTLIWARKYVHGSAWVIAALVGVNIGLWDVCREARSDTLFSALFIWAAVIFSKALDADNSKKSIVFAAMGTLICVAAVCTRQVGIFLPIGYLLAELIRWGRGNKRAMRVSFATVAGIVPAAAVLALIIRDHHAAMLDHAPVVITYVEQYRQPNVGIYAQLIDGVRRQTADVGRLLIPGMWGSFAHFGQWLNFNSILYAGFSIPVVLGWWKIARQTADPLLCAVPLYAAMFVIWPFDQGTRFNVPMLPVLWVSLWMSLSRFTRQRERILAILLVLHCTASLVYLVHDAPMVNRWNQQIPAMAMLASKVNDNAPATTVGGAPNDLLIWRYLLDRPVIGLQNANTLQLADTAWLFQAVSRPAPLGFVEISRSSHFKLFERRR